MEQNVIVSESSSDLRTLGRQVLSGNWGTAVLGTLIQTVIVILPVIIVNVFFESQFTEGIVNLYSVFISGPISLGYAMFMIQIFRGVKALPSEIFSGFEYFGRALSVYITIALLAFICFIPFLICVFLAFWVPLFPLGILVGILAVIAFFLGAAGAVIVQYRYAMAYYVLADNPQQRTMDCLRESKRIMQGNKWKLFCLEISFIGWVIVCIFTVGIGSLWLTPYMSASTIAFYEIARGNLKVKRTDETTGDWNSGFNREGSIFEPTVAAEPRAGNTPNEGVNEKKTQEGSIENEQKIKENDGEGTKESERKNPFEIK